MYDYFKLITQPKPQISRECLRTSSRFPENLQNYSAMTISKRSLVFLEREADVVNQESELARTSNPTVGRELAGPSMRLNGSRQHVRFYELSILSQSRLSSTSDSFDVHKLMFSRLTGEMQNFHSVCTKLLLKFF